MRCRSCFQRKVCLNLPMTPPSSNCHATLPTRFTETPELKTPTFRLRGDLDFQALQWSPFSRSPLQSKDSKCMSGLNLAA